jgi:hypothetical protein
VVTTRFTRPAADAELLNSQALWVAEQLRAYHADDPAAVTAADTIAAEQSGVVDLPGLSFAECRAILSVLVDELPGQPQPQEMWRLDQLRRLVALELDLRDSESA